MVLTHDEVEYMNGWAFGEPWCPDFVLGLPPSYDRGGRAIGTDEPVEFEK